MIFEIKPKLYLIEILHQTTTLLLRYLLPLRCILSKFYIKPQLHSASSWGYRGCILSKFYIKPQPFRFRPFRRCCCSLSKFYIKPQQQGLPCDQHTVVSYRNSTSNHNRTRVHEERPCVVSYRNSTSNHNTPAAVLGSSGLYLIEILHQTTTAPLSGRETA